MPLNDLLLVLRWWSVLFLFGAAAFPLTKVLFSGWPASPETSSRGWFDRGYFFSKAVGMAIIPFLVYLFGTLHVLPFTGWGVGITMGIVFVGGVGLSFGKDKTNKTYKTDRTDKKKIFSKILLIMVEEVFFFGALILWSWVKAHEPSIRGLEKFMDFGFMQSILNSKFFPAPDMWWAGGNINYYYFGHLVTAVLTKMSGMELGITFNLMLATIFALCVTMSFSVGYQLISIFKTRPMPQAQHKAGSLLSIEALCSGLLTAFLVTMAGNMQTIYAFTKGYTGENVAPFWNLLWSIKELPEKIGVGMLTYWYANATRFIPFTIHEFPSYSFVVSDVHGHVLSIPFVLLAIGMLIQMVIRDTRYVTRDTKTVSHFTFHISHIFYGFLVGILLMTNALDGPIYFGLLTAILAIQNSKFRIQNNWEWWIEKGKVVGVVAVTALLTALPFLWHFKSFATGIGVNCPPAFLANSKIGPFLFEEVGKCQHSPLWMMWLLWGFFWYAGVWLFFRFLWQKEEQNSPIIRILKVFYLFSLVLVIFPEFFYIKDIYPAHFRSNTMFKLGYQAFIMWSIIAGFVVTKMLFWGRDKTNKTYKTDRTKTIIRAVFFFFLMPQIFLVSIFPIFSIRSYFGELKIYRGLDGTAWLKQEYADDWKAIEWLKNEIRDTRYVTRKTDIDVSHVTFHVSPIIIVESDGDSYTDYNHISAFSGVPTIVGWAVHEWLWRGSYDVVAPRREDIRLIYESTDIEETKNLLQKYSVTYVIVGTLERQKYQNLEESKFWQLGTVAFQSGNTAVYAVGY